MAQSFPISRNRGRFESPASRYAVKAVDKALRILEILGKNSVELSLVELTRHLNIEKSTLHRLLATLDGRDFVRKDPASLRYSLGIKMLELGTAVTARSALGRTAAPLLDRLAVRYRQTINLAVLDGLEILYVAKRESPEPMRLTVEVGRRLPAHSTALGKAMLAFRPAPEVRRLLSRKRKLQRCTPHTITSPRRLLQHLEEVRRAGFAVDREELTLGMRCVAAPVLDFTGYAVAAVSITAPVALLSEERAAMLGRRLIAGVADVSRALGGPGDPRTVPG